MIYTKTRTDSTLQTTLGTSSVSKCGLGARFVTVNQSLIVSKKIIIIVYLSPNAAVRATNA